MVGYIAAILGGTLYAGGLSLQSMLGMNLTTAILFFAITTGAYTIYGGLTSAAWTDFLQVCLLLTAGVLIPVLGLWRVGGLENLMQQAPEKFHVFLPPTHERFPFTGVFTGFLTVGIWYTCTSQHMVQRVLGAKDEWHARMGVVSAGYLRIITPFFFVLPGIIAFKLYPELPRQDMAYLTLVKELIPTGLRGLILAGMAAALMSNVSSVLNSASTLATMDLYGKLIRPQASEKELVTVGRISGVVILIVSVLVGLYYSTQGESLYVQLQRVFFFIAPPFAVIFTLGLLWRRANATAAVWTIVLGFAFTAFLVFWAFPTIPWLQPYKTYQHPALLGVGLLHGGDDRRLAADRAPAAGENRRHHLEPQLRQAAGRVATEIRRVEGLPHLVGHLRGVDPVDLRIFLLVPVPAITVLIRPTETFRLPACRRSSGSTDRSRRASSHRTSSHPACR